MYRKSAWYLHTKKADFDKIAKENNISPFLARIIINRDIKEENIDKFLNPDEADMHSPELLKDVKAAVLYLDNVLKSDKSLCVVGDYDIDGVCATYILVKALKNLGVNVYYEIPDRVKDGYGINENIIENIKNNNIDLVLTCDNGIAAFEALKKAKEYGITTIITDHHDIRKDENKDILPDADFIINPKREDCSYPFKSICGANVAYKFMLALYKYRNENLEIFDELLEFVCIATVGDVMPLVDENRYIVKQGLKKLQKSKNLGLRMLIRECDLENKKIDSFHIGFIIGPCLNAGGRLQSAKIALQLFLEEGESTAFELAKKLIELNNIRKDMTAKAVEEAIQKIEESYIDDKVLLVYLKDVHESLAGIIAGRIKERYNKPALVFTDAHEGLIKGSARSIKAYNIFEKLQEADKYLEKYGGHPMAAGLSLKKENFEKLRRFLNKNSFLTDEDLIEKIYIDIALPFSYINENFIEELSKLEPFGNANEKPAFALKGIKVKNIKIIGQNKNVLRASLEGVNKNRIEAVLFGEDVIDFFETVNNEDLIDLIYYPSFNEYQGNKTLQVIIKQWQLSKN